MKVLVTGGAGFIGSHLVNALIDKGLDVVVVDNLSTGKEANINQSATFINADICSTNIRDIFDIHKPQITFHLAAQSNVRKSMTSPIEDMQNNIAGSINLLQCCVATGVEKIVYASSAAVYGLPEILPINETHRVKPLSPYGISKHTVEHYLDVYYRTAGLKYTILRYSNVYGERQDPAGEGGVISVFLDRLQKDEPVLVYGDGEQTRDFINVQDVVEANIKAMIFGSGEVFNISTGKSTSINNLIKTIERTFSKNIKIGYQASRSGDIKDSLLSNNKACQYLFWTPVVGLEEGISNMNMRTLSA